jgi:putative PIN family toxin of toxin-antitoxin system
MRLVLDTNVWVDWLVFDDPSIAPLKVAQQARQVDIVVNEPCLQELRRVLTYPQFALTSTQRADHLEAAERMVVRHDDALSPSRHNALPKCHDPDDQKFLELARAASADWLLTRDKALLRLRRRLLALGIRLGSPADWSTALLRAS